MRGYVAEEWFSIQTFMLLCRISDPNVLPLSFLSTHSDQRSKRQTPSLCSPASFSFELGLSKTVGNRHPLIQIPLVVHSPFIICCVLQSKHFPNPSPCFHFSVCSSSRALCWLVHLSWLSHLRWLIALTAATLGKRVLPYLLSCYLKVCANFPGIYLSHVTCFLNSPFRVSFGISDLMI